MSVSGEGWKLPPVRHAAAGNVNFLFGADDEIAKRNDRLKMCAGLHLHQLDRDCAAHAYCKQGHQI